MTDYATDRADSAYHRTLPIGERVSSAREHVRLEDAPVELLVGLGPFMQRVSGAVKAVPGVARRHFARWGDGSEHFRIVAESLAAGGGEAFPGA